MPTQSIKMNDADFERLRKVIYERSGIHFQASRKYVLESRLARRLEELGFERFSQYIMFLTAGPFQDDEFQEMFNRITINETSFFRNGPQLEHFEQKILPELLEARRQKRRLRIWSAACSSGEEPYTLAMQLHRSLGVRLSDWHIEILGTDISEKVLDAAADGLYSNYSLRSVPANVVRQYFTQEGDRYRLDPTIKSMVRFERLNLKDTLAARRFGTFDVIFCRNVLIYFDTDMKAQCAQLFHDRLADDGYLILGHSESLRDVDVPFDATSVPHAFAYTKQRNAKTTTANATKKGVCHAG